MAHLTSENRKAEKPLVIFLRLYGAAKKSMREVCKKHKTDHNSVGMAGTLAEMRRIADLAPEVTAAEAKAIAEIRRLGYEPLSILQSALANPADYFSKTTDVEINGVVEKMFAPRFSQNLAEHLAAGAARPKAQPTRGSGRRVP